MLRRSILSVATAVAALAGIAQASAADMPMKARAPVYAPVMSWTGFFVGAHVGGAWGAVEAEIPPVGGLLGAAFPIASHATNGFLGGVQAGYDWQSGWVVLGIKGDFSWTDTKGSTPCIIVATCSANYNYLATVTGRIGGLVGDRTLVYVRGGGAWMDADYSFNLLGLFNTTASATRFGWTVGMGAEYMFAPGWSGFIEYNYMDFDTETLGFPVVAIIGGPALTVNTNLTDKLHTMKAGLNFRFAGR